MSRLKQVPLNMESDIKSEFRITEDKFEHVREKSVNKWILKHVFYKYNIIVIIFFISLALLASIMGATISVLIGDAIDSFDIGNMASLIPYTLAILFFGIGTPVVGLIYRILRETLAQRLERDVRKEFYLVLLGKSQSFHESQKLGDLMARAANDVRMLNFLISPGVSMVFETFLNLSIPILTLIVYDYPDELLIIPCLVTIIFLLSLSRFVKTLGPLTNARRIEFGNMNAVLNESLDGIEIIKSMAQEDQSIEKYRASAIAYRNAGIKSGFVQARFLPLLYFSIAITFGLTHSIILYRTNPGIISVGRIFTYLSLLRRLSLSTNISRGGVFIIQRAKAAAERLVDTMTAKSEISDLRDPIAKEMSGRIEFKDVNFQYPGTKNYILKNINFEIQPGKVIAIVGTTGSGKTTLTKLLSRLYDVTSGQILVDDVDVKSYSLQSLRDQIAYIEQDVFLFSKSVKDNIAFGKEFYNEEQIISVAKEAQAHDFIKNLPEEYNTQVGERGVQLSGGERQRIAIARAFLSNPRILVLDDASSAIDAKTEEKIQRAISRILYKRTTLLITHRLSQIRWADQIIVLKKGEIVARGSHQDLLKTSKEYRKIFVKRFDKTLNELLGGNEI